MAVGFMRAWKNSRQVGRELNIHHKTIQQGWPKEGGMTEDANATPWIRSTVENNNGYQQEVHHRLQKEPIRQRSEA